MPRLVGALLGTVVFVGLLGAPVRYLLPPDPTVQAPFVPVVLLVVVFVSDVLVYRAGLEGGREVTGPEAERTD